MKLFRDCKDGKDDKGRWNGRGGEEIEREPPAEGSLSRPLSVQAEKGVTLGTLLYLWHNQKDGGGKEWKEVVAQAEGAPRQGGSRADRVISRPW